MACVSGVLATGEPGGADIRLADTAIPAYAALPPGAADTPPRPVLVIVTDVLGHRLPNTRLLADTFARHTGFTCIVPDLLGGDPVPMTVVAGPRPAADKHGLPEGWLDRHGDAQTLPVLEQALAAIRAQFHASAIGVIGYCWGGRYALLAAARGWAQAYACAHPAGVRIPDDLANVRAPGLFLCPAADPLFPPQARDAAVETLRGQGAVVEMRVFAGVQHGFAVRGNAEEAAAKAEAAQASCAFFKKYLV